MLGRRLAPLVVAIGALGLALTGCSDQSAAARVGDQTLSEADLIDELKAYADNEAFLEATGQGADSLQGDAEGSFSQEFVGQILEQRVTFMLVGELFDDEELVLADGDRSAAREQLTSQLGGAFDSFSTSYQDQLVDDYARLVSLQTALGQEGFATALREVAETTEVELNSRYGTFDVDALLNQQPAITPPEGPAPREADEADDAGTAGDPEAPDSP
ncbi:MAG: hypothetical protein ACRD2C_06605 [Acidimicrobiales bacterium]